MAPLACHVNIFRKCSPRLRTLSSKEVDQHIILIDVTFIDDLAVEDRFKHTQEYFIKHRIST